MGVDIAATMAKRPGAEGTRLRQSLTRFAGMRTEYQSPSKSPARATSRRRFKVGYRASINADVLRLVPGDKLVLLLSTGQKITVAADKLPNGKKLKGSDKTELVGTVTRVGDSIAEEHVPVSLQLDAWQLTRITVGAGKVRPAR